MKKEVVVFLFALIFLSGSFLVLAQNDTEDRNAFDPIDKTYSCLENEVDDKDSLSLQEAVFGLLALGSEKKLTDEIESEKSSDECWPKSRCNIRETAQVLLAYERIDKNTDDIIDWLKDKTQNVNDLTWFVEIDIVSHEPSVCTVSYDNRDYNFEIRDDMTLDGNPGNCFDIGYSGYWLRLRDRCLNQIFEFSCDKDFVTSLAYQKSSGGTIYVSSQTHSASSLRTTEEKITSKCFSTGRSCDYEGTLWATLSLDKSGEDISDYIPYLLALSDSNKKYFPDTFLYVLTGGEDKYSAVVEQHKQGNYWDIVGSPYNRFYDTSLAMLALVGTGSGEVFSAQNYLLSVQTKDGCWNNNNIRDTAFILYSGWPRTAKKGNGTVPVPVLTCEESGNFCAPLGACLESGGATLQEFACPVFRDVCCTVPVRIPNCGELNGNVCSSSQRCEGGNVVPTIDGSCCVDGGICVESRLENTCIISDGVCRTSCFSDEIIADESCSDQGQVCCLKKFVPPPEPPDGIPIWIWIVLGILIVLLILGIIFRKRIQLWMHSRKGPSRSRPPGRRPPGLPPGAVMGSPRPRYGPPGARPAPSSMGGPIIRKSTKATTPEDKEMEETLRKLKEISK